MIRRTANLIVIFCLFLSPNALGAADGWASENDGTTGGQDGTVVTVDNFTDLEYYAGAAAPYIIQVSGTIDIGDDGFDIAANKTIIGLGSDTTLVGNVGFENREGNIILENLNITNPYTSGEKDGISLKHEIYNVLITKCTIYDCSDGLLDISNESDLVTVSWCKFYYTNPTAEHRFSNLIGSSDDQILDRGKLRITYHHNLWSSNCHERMPRVRFGEVHIYNNYYDCSGNNYCIGVGNEAHIRVENNYFNNVDDPWEDYYATGKPSGPGKIGWNTGNIFYNCTQPTWATNEYATIFTPPYDYTLDDAADLPTIVPAYAGADTPYPPHWVLGPYGDFDTDGDVDWEDFETFVDYWMDTVDINDADYYANVRVDMAEFALFASNWLMGI